MIRLLLFALLFAVPAFADNVFMDNTTSESNMCVIGITGQTTSNPAAVARATYSPITYHCAAGTYLPADGIECVVCPAGNYCGGGDYAYNETTDQGINPCPAADSTTEYTTYPADFYSPIRTSFELIVDTTGLQTISRCYATYDFTNARGNFRSWGYFDTTTNKYSSWINSNNNKRYTKINPGYYASTRYYTDAECASNPSRRQYYSDALPCPAGSYCPGFTSATDFPYCDAETYGDTKGINACPSSYPSSDVGTSSQDYCYRACTTSDVAHTSTVTGHYYYNDNNQCEPTSNGCSPGYHYTDAFDPSTDSITIPGTSGEYHSNDDENITSNGASLPIGGWAVTWNSGDKRGTLSGIASCNTEWGTPFVTTVPSNSMNTSNTGKNCWCKATSWTTYGGYPQSLIADWVLRGAFGNSSEWCANGCVSDCANNGVKSIPEFRSAVFNAIRFGLAQCDANTITIDWSGYGAGNNQTQQTQCTYGGSITTPTDAPTKRGHVFVGWTFDLGN